MAPTLLAFAGAAGCVLALSLLAWRATEGALGRGWALAGAVALSVPVVLLPGGTAVAMALAAASAALRLGDRPWERALAAAGALAALALSPGIGAPAVALAGLRSEKGALALELGSATAIALLLHLALSPRIVVAMAAGTLLAALAPRLLGRGVVPARAAAAPAALCGGALALIALVLVDDRRALVPGDAVWTALALGLAAGAAGMLAGLAAYGTATIAATRSDARGLVLAALGVVPIAAALVDRESIAYALVGAVAPATVGLALGLGPPFVGLWSKET